MIIKNKLIFLLVLIAFTPLSMHCPLQAQHETFVFIPTNVSASIFGQVKINGINAAQGDWIAAFDENQQCVGASELIISDGDAYISLVIYGDDLTTDGDDEGMNEGEMFTLKVWDSSLDQLTTYPDNDNPTLFAGWINTNGAPLSGYEDYTQVYDFFAEDSSLSIEFEEFLYELMKGGIAIQFNLYIPENMYSIFLEKAKDGQLYYPIFEEKQMDRSFLSLNYMDRTPYYGTNFYRIKCINSDGYEYIGQTYVVTYKFGDFKIYPNPATDLLHIEFESNEMLNIGQLTIRDINGLHCSAVMLDQRKNIDLDISNLEPGTYFLTIQTLQSERNLGAFIKLK